MRWAATVFVPPGVPVATTRSPTLMSPSDPVALLKNLVDEFVTTVVVLPLNVATVSVEPSMDCSMPTVPRRPLPCGPAGCDADAVAFDPPPERAFAPAKPPTARMRAATPTITHVRLRPAPDVSWYGDSGGASATSSAAGSPELAGRTLDVSSFR